MRATTNYFETIRILVAGVIILCFALVTAHAPRGSASPASQAQNTTVRPARIRLNNEDLGTSDDPSLLRRKLAEVFKTRTEQHAYKPGFERRVELREADRIEKTVFIKADRATRLEQVTRVCEAIEEAGAEPVLLPIYLPGRTARDCGTCALRDRSVMKPNPLILLVRLRQANSPDPLDAHGLPSISEFLISDGISIVRSDAASGETLAVITIPRDGEYTSGEKPIEKAALEKEIRDRIKTKPQSQRVVAIKCSPDIAYGSLEDVYQAAFAAGIKHIILDTGKQTIAWENQGMRFTVPSGWRISALSGQCNETFRLQGPDDAGLMIDVLDNQEESNIERGLNEEYELQLKRQQQREIEEVRYLELAGAKGVLVRFVLEGSHGRVMDLHWQGFRRTRGKQQYILLSLSIPLESFDKRRAEFNDILNSIKLTQN